MRCEVGSVTDMVDYYMALIEAAEADPYALLVNIRTAVVRDPRASSALATLGGSMEAVNLTVAPPVEEWLSRRE